MSLGANLCPPTTAHQPLAPSRQSGVFCKALPLVFSDPGIGKRNDNTASQNDLLLLNLGRQGILQGLATSLLWLRAAAPPLGCSLREAPPLCSPQCPSGTLAAGGGAHPGHRPWVALPPWDAHHGQQCPCGWIASPPGTPLQMPEQLAPLLVGLEYCLYLFLFLLISSHPCSRAGCFLKEAEQDSMGPRCSNANLTSELQERLGSDVDCLKDLWNLLL